MIAILMQHCKMGGNPLNMAFFGAKHIEIFNIHYIQNECRFLEVLIGPSFQ